MPNALETLGTGETYTTIQAWEDALDNAHFHQGECKAEVFANVTFNGDNYTETNYPHLTAQSGAEHDGRAHEVSGAGNARLEVAGGSRPFLIYDGYIRISWLEVKGPGAVSVGIVEFAAIGETAFTIHHCIAHNNHSSSSSSQHGFYLGVSDALWKAYRNIVYGCGASGITIHDTGAAAGSSVLLNTVYENNVCLTKGGIQTGYSVWEITGNACFDQPYSDIVGTGGTLDYNATSDGTGDNEGANGIANLVTVDQFVNPTTTWADTDLLLKSGADVIDEGTSFNPNTYPEINVSIDQGATRDTITGTWDIGASELAEEVGEDITVEPAALTLTASVLAPTIKVTFVAAVLALVLSLLAPTATVTVLPGAQALTISVLTPTIVIDVMETPAALGLTSSVLAPVPMVTTLPSALGLTAEVLSPTIVIDATHSPSALSLTASVLAPVPTAIASPSILGLTISVLAPTIVIDVMETPAALGLTSAVLTLVPEVKVTPPVLSLTSTVLTPTPTVISFPSALGLASSILSVTVGTIEDVTITPDAFALTSAVLAPVPSVTVLPSTFELTASVLTPVLSVVTLPSALELTSSLLTPISPINTLPATQALTTSVLAPTVIIDATETPTTLSLTMTLLTSVPEVKASPSALSLTSTALAPAIIIDATHSPSTLSLTTSVLAPVPTAIASPSILGLTISVLTPTIVIDTTLEPGVLALTALLLSSDAKVISVPSALSLTVTALTPTPEVKATPSTLGLTISVLAPTIVADTTFTPDALALTAAVLAPISTVSTLPSALELTASVLAPTTNLKATPNALSLTLTLLSPTISATERIFEVDSANSTITLNAPTTIGGVTNNVQISAAGVLGFTGLAGLQLPHMMQSDSTTQSVASTTAAQVITFDTDVHHFGITRTTSSRFTILTEASYLIIISALCDTTVANKDIEVWLRVNGNDVANTNTIVHLGTAAETTLAVSFLQHFDVNDYFEFWMTGENTGCRLLATAAGTTPTRPACPSIIMTCNYIGVD